MARRASRDNVTKERRGNSDGYGLQRLERERPDLLERVRSSELSTHAAMVEAGFRKKSITLSLDPRRAAASLLNAFPREQLQVIKRVLDLELLPEPDGPTEPPPKQPAGWNTYYYAVVDGDEVSKHRKISLAFRALDRLLQERGEPLVAVWVQDERGRCFH
jgi:hypothetical protein